VRKAANPDGWRITTAFWDPHPEYTYEGVYLKNFQFSEGGIFRVEVTFYAKLSRKYADNSAVVDRLAIVGDAGLLTHL
jgi:hypothetical protein